MYIERELKDIPNWDASAIDKRRTPLLEWARNRWAVDLSGIENVDREHDVHEDEEHEV